MDIPSGYFFVITGGSFVLGTVVTYLAFQIFGFGKGSSGDSYNEKKKEGKHAKPEDLIKYSQNIDELKQNIKKIGYIEGSGKTYEWWQVNAAIDAYVMHDEGGRNLLYPPKNEPDRREWLKKYHKSEEDAKGIELAIELYDKMAWDPLLKRQPENAITRGGSLGIREKVQELVKKKAK